jgi:predicted nuclease with RNAse H fold
VITVGVDLGAEPKRTAVAALQWIGRDVYLTDVLTTADDDVILELAAAADKVGIDCPLGWSDEFVEFVNAHHTGRVDTTPVDSFARTPLRYRATDLDLIEKNLGRPLSVSSDLIGVCAMRAAGLLAAMTMAGMEVDRSGVSGRVAETYPAAAIKHWNLGHAGYKGTAKTTALGEMVDQLKYVFPQLDLGDFERICRASDDAFDAVICAIVARATTVYRGTAQIPSGLIQRAKREGWIAVPTCHLFELLAPPEFE